MPVRRDPRTGGWFFRTTVKTLDGRKLRLYGTPGVPGPYHDLAATKVGAQEAEQRAIQEVVAPKPPVLVQVRVCSTVGLLSTNASRVSAPEVSYDAATVHAV